MSDLTTVLLGGLAGLLLGPALSIPLIKKILKIHRYPACAINMIQPGKIIEVAGKAESEFDSIRSPLTQTPCVLWHVEVLEGKGDESATLETVVSETSSHPFYVKDSTGRIAVYPIGADLLLHDDLVREAGLVGTFSPAIREAVEKLGISTIGPLNLAQPLQVYEQVVKSGETVCILGKTNNKNGQPTFLSSKDGSPFLISDRSRNAVLGTLYFRTTSRILLLIPLGAIIALLISKIL